MDGYLTKPFRIIDLVETFAKYLPEAKCRTVTETPSIPAADYGKPAASQAEMDQPPVIDEQVLCEAVGCEVGEGGVSRRHRPGVARR